MIIINYFYLYYHTIEYKIFDIFNYIIPYYMIRRMVDNQNLSVEDQGKKLSNLM